MTARLATSEDAHLILKLYELRTDSVMREARAWVIDVFWPHDAREVLEVFGDIGSQENHFLRQVTSYWEMACSFVLHGALSEELFIECNSEPFFLYAKFEPMLAEIRRERPMFLKRTGECIERLPDARARLDELRGRVDARRAKAAGGA